MPTKFTVNIYSPTEMREYTGVTSYDWKSFHGSTYLVLSFPNKVDLWLNDFGTRSVLFRPEGVELPESV